MDKFTDEEMANSLELRESLKMSLMLQWIHYNKRKKEYIMNLSARIVLGL